MKYTITLQPGGHSFAVEDDQLILDAALEQGVVLPYGCRNGTCGSCVARVITGIVDYPNNELPSSLNEADIADGYALLCKAIAQSDLVIEAQEISVAKDIEIKTLSTQVESKIKLNHDVIQIKLKLPAEERLQFLAGQYIEILLNDGDSRVFSLANAPQNDKFIELHIRHVEGGEYTTYVMNEMQEKASIRIKGPFGSFFLREDSDKPVIMLAGGVGFAPVKGIMEHVLATGSNRDIVFYWGACSREDLYMNELAESWAENENVHYIPVLSEPKNSDDWQGRTGFVHEAVMQDFSDLSEHEVYVCGPPVMVEVAKESFATIGLNSDQLYYDSFDFAHKGA